MKTRALLLLALALPAAPALAADPALVAANNAAPLPNIVRGSGGHPSNGPLQIVIKDPSKVPSMAKRRTRYHAARPHSLSRRTRVAVR